MKSLGIEIICNIVLDKIIENNRISITEIDISC